MCFVSLVLTEFVKAFAFRSETRSSLRGLLANRWLVLAVAWELLLLALIVYVPALHGASGTFSLTATDCAVAGAAALTIAPALEAAKGLVARWVRPGRGAPGAR